MTAGERSPVSERTEGVPHIEKELPVKIQSPARTLIKSKTSLVDRRGMAFKLTFHSPCCPC